MHDSQEDADHEVKKARVADQKKQKINQLMQEHEAMIRVVKVGTDEFAKMHDYSTELDMSVDVLDDEYWCDEDQVVPDALWSNLPLDKPPPNPEPWVDQLADEIEIQRLLEMGVLQKREECTDEICGNLTTRFVYDWRVKQHRHGQQMWMRRSRFVAREFANVKRHDTYSPASGSHTANLVPLVFSEDDVRKFGKWLQQLRLRCHPGIIGHQRCLPPSSSGGDCWGFPIWKRIGDQTKPTRSTFGSKSMVLVLSQLRSKML
jgi:hypothetical protein